MKFALLFVMLATAMSAASKTDVVAAVIIGEAGGEGREGMRAVASVIQNRTNKWRNSYRIATAPLQFSAYNGYANRQEILVNRAKKHPHWTYAVELATQLETSSVEDNTDGSDHYHNTTVAPRWADKMTFKTRIGGHLFYKS